MTENEMVGWHHQLNGHESEQALADGDGQGSLVCYHPWSHKESDTIEHTYSLLGFHCKWVAFVTRHKITLNTERYGI